MIKINRCLAIVFLLLNHLFCNVDFAKAEKITLFDYTALDEFKSRVEQNDDDAKRAYDQLLQEADSALEYDVFSVVNKTGLPPSGNKHDYMTIGPYWWPNPDTENGLPYIRKDGEINPETRNNFTDFVELESFFTTVGLLTKAYYCSEDKVYATKAIVLIRGWFIDEQTRMNPSINYGQSIPGKIEGRKFAIIEFERVLEVLKCLELLEDHQLLDANTEKGIKTWLTDYAHWLMNSEIGRGEANTKNNHGTHYDMQLLSILTYLGRIEEVQDYLKTITQNRIFSQIEPDGSQPLELARTKSFSYSVMNLHAFLYLARLGQKIGVDLWSALSDDGRSIKMGYLYMINYLNQEKVWEYKQIIDAKKDTKKVIRDMKMAQDLFGEDAFAEILRLHEETTISVRFKD